MDPARKRKIRLIVALSAAVLLAVALVYTSFSASTEAKQPSEILNASPDELLRPDRGGRARARSAIAARSSTSGSPTATTARPRSRSATRGEVPDPFRDGREVIVTGKVEDGTFVAERDSLVTKCPSKFQDEAEQDPEHVIITE